MPPPPGGQTGRRQGSHDGSRKIADGGPQTREPKRGRPLVVCAACPPLGSQKQPVAARTPWGVPCSASQGRTDCRLKAASSASSPTGLAGADSPASPPPTTSCNPRP